MENYIITSDGQASLEALICPFCEADIENGFLFGGPDGRCGGFGTCYQCNLEFAWIDNPFECDVAEVEQ